jgi:hypothetical protein
MFKTGKGVIGSTGCHSTADHICRPKGTNLDGTRHAAFATKNAARILSVVIEIL